MAKNNKYFYKFRDALRYVLANYENKDGEINKEGVIRVKKGHAMLHIATGLVSDAIYGAPLERAVARKELLDRSDGKAVQAITGIEGEPITIIKRVIVHQLVEGEDNTNLIEARDVKKLN